MSTREGPSVTSDRSCAGCRYEKSVGYRCQGDSGQDVSCTHPSVGTKAIGDTTWKTPDWCPFLVAASPSAERILTQATDVDEAVALACAAEIAHEAACYSEVVAIIRRHFPARSGAAVVMPNEHTPSPTATEYQEGQDVGWNKCLAEIRRLNPAPEQTHGR